MFEGVGGPGRPRTPVRVLDARLKPGGEFIIEPETGSNVFACVYEGSLEATDPSGRARQAAAPALAVFDGEGPIQARAGNEGAALLYCEGAPISEPVARHGPFVMNTRAEIEQASRTSTPAASARLERGARSRKGEFDDHAAMRSDARNPSTWG